MLSDALSLARAVNDPLLLLQTLTNLALESAKVGLREGVLNYLDEAREIARELADPHQEIVVMNQYGQVYWSWGDYENNIRYSEQELQLARQMGNKAMVAATLNNLSIALSELDEEKYGAQVYDYIEESVLAQSDGE